jgi:general secretion pathway protein A
MEFGLMRDIGLMLITGEIGIGKTTLLRFFLDHLEEEVRPANILNTNVNPDQLLGLILQEFEVGVQTNSKVIALQALQDFLHEMRSQDLRPLLIIDDAQNLSSAALEEVRLMSNLHDGDRALLQILLVGQPELKAKISNPAMLSFAQRVGVNYHLSPLTHPETVEYITHRLKSVGGNPELFTRGAIELIYKAAVGIPRAINLLCDNALVYGFVDELQSINERTVKQVIDEVGSLFPWFEAPADPKRDSNGGRPKPHQGAADSDNGAAAGTEVEPGGWQQLEARVASLERIIEVYTKELHKMLKSQMYKDRNRADKLLMECTRLKLKLESIEKFEFPAERKWSK